MQSNQQRSYYFGWRTNTSSKNWRVL